MNTPDPKIPTPEVQKKTKSQSKPDTPKPKAVIQGSGTQAPGSGKTQSSQKKQAGSGATQHDTKEKSHEASKHDKKPVSPNNRPTPSGQNHASYADALKSSPVSKESAKSRHCKRTGICDGKNAGEFRNAQDSNGTPNHQKFDQWYSNSPAPAGAFDRTHMHTHLENERDAFNKQHRTNVQSWKDAGRPKGERPKYPNNIAAYWSTENGENRYRLATSGQKASGNSKKKTDPDYAASVAGQEKAFLNKPPKESAPHSEHSIYYNTAHETGNPAFQGGHVLSMDTSTGKLRPACVGNCRGNTAVHKVQDEYYNLAPPGEWPGKIGPVNREGRKKMNQRLRKQNAESSASESSDSATGAGSPMSVSPPKGGSPAPGGSPMSLTRREINRGILRRELARRWRVEYENILRRGIVVSV